MARMPVLPVCVSDGSGSPQPTGEDYSVQRGGDTW